MLTKTLTYTVPCTWCEGSGVITRWNNDKLERCPVCYGQGNVKVVKETELTDIQIEQVDLLHDGIWTLMRKLTKKDLPWDMEWIGELADVITAKAIELTGLTEMEIYPYHEEEVGE